MVEKGNNGFQVVNIVTYHYSVYFQFDLNMYYFRIFQYLVVWYACYITCFLYFSADRLWYNDQNDQKVMIYFFNEDSSSMFILVFEINPVVLVFLF